MDQHIVLKEIRESKNNCEAFFERHFRGLLPHGRGVGHDEGHTTEESKELEKRVHSLREAVKVEKEYIDGEINTEAEKYREMVIEMRTHIDGMQLEMGKLFSNIDVADRKVTAGESQLDGGVQTGGDNNYKSATPFRSDRGSSGKVDLSRHCGEGPHEEAHKTDETDETDEANEMDEAHKTEEANELESLLRKSIDAKSRLENIKRGLLFLKAFPSLKKTMNELFLIVKNVQLDIKEKIHKAIILHSNMLYINEHEEIISYFKIYLSSIDVCIYSAEFFEEFFALLNSILSFFLTDTSSQVDLNRIVHIYVQTFRTYLKFIHMYVYREGYIIEEITKKIVHFIVSNFRKTFLKFTQSESGTAVHNAVINYYEYFTTLIEENQAAMRRVVRQLCEEVSAVSEVGGEGGKRGQQGHLDHHEQSFLVRLYKEAIQVVGPMIAEQTKQLRDEKSGASKRKGAATHRIMDALSVSVNILSNSPFLIGEKNMLSRILNEAIFMSDDVMAEHVAYLSDASHFDMHCFEEINTKVSTFDRNDLMTENKLHTFFTQLEQDITKIIEKKKKEINTKEIFNSPFFKFLPFFSFTFNHDTEFLLLFINVYNFVYEIIYNMKDQIRRKEKNEKRKRISFPRIPHDDDQSRYLCIKEELDSSNELIQYVKTAMTIFIQIVNTFVNITKLYESFGKFLFERTHVHFTSRSLLNVISRNYLNRQGKYPAGVDPNIEHIHAYFEKGVFPRRVPLKGGDARESTVAGGRRQRGAAEQHRTWSAEEYTSPEAQHTTAATEQEAFAPGDEQPHRKIQVEVDAEEELLHLDEHECGKHLLKSSLGKLNDIKNTIIKNVIHLALIPLYDYTNKYTAKMDALLKEDKVETSDPEENICFIVETIFLYIHTFHEHGSQYLTDLLFDQIADMFLSSVGSMSHLNETLLRQLQADTEYFLNVCKRLKVRNYKPFLLFSCSLSFVLTRGNREGNLDNASNLRVEVQAYLSDWVKREGQEEEQQEKQQEQQQGSVHPFGITTDDAVTAEAHVTRLLSRLQ
ncbi:hypothetical protein C922_01572 [Plasmodium inui San Antonio 1]|uniref:Uncharacterized protein n=1 Tax=Plasmodium inui San Antonio 1 TaxID=1237626 RepID=W7A8C8_9APIC|nr:hypothetical protein C922_01572 [Plasmodium inui San Antonio 1]EUD67960.1 hypothetical protein C922_01572 [Plasmodium inui San Antonio 1]